MKAGDLPDWWLMIDTALYLGVAPWDLAGIPDTAGHPAWALWGATHKQVVEQVQAHYRKHRPKPKR